MLDLMAGSTGLEPATSGLTVQCANQAAPRARRGMTRVYPTGGQPATTSCAARAPRAARTRVLGDGQVRGARSARLPRDGVGARAGEPIRGLRHEIASRISLR